jgi:hypothetical protein
MGWTGTHRPHGMSLRQYFQEYSLGDNYEILDFATVKRKTCYMLVKRKEHQKPDGTVVPEKIFAAVYLVTFSPKSYYNLSYKDLDETCGPSESECPERILKRLPPTEYEYAIAWRKRCWDNINRRKNAIKLMPGDIIKFGNTMRFTDGVHRDIFRVSRLKHGRPQFVDDVGYPVNLRRDSLISGNCMICLAGER